MKKKPEKKNIAEDVDSHFESKWREKIKDLRDVITERALVVESASAALKEARKGYDGAVQGLLNAIDGSDQALLPLGDSEDESE